jgi:hypothetical protein
VGAGPGFVGVDPLVGGDADGGRRDGGRAVGKNGLVVGCVPEGGGVTLSSGHNLIDVIAPLLVSLTLIHLTLA